MESIIHTKNKELCYVCGNLASEEHHVFMGKNRKNADKYGLTVNLCPMCHRTSFYAVHGRDGHLLDKVLKMVGQTKFEELYGHDKFMEVFGKNYLDKESEDIINEFQQGSNGWQDR